MIDEVIDEVNRLKLTVRYERHMAGIKMSKFMLIDNVKPYTYRPLKNKAWPGDIHEFIADDGPACKWPPKQDRGELPPLPTYRMTIYE